MRVNIADGYSDVQDPTYHAIMMSVIWSTIWAGQGASHYEPLYPIVPGVTLRPMGIWNWSEEAMTFVCTPETRH